MHSFRLFSRLLFCGLAVLAARSDLFAQGFSVTNLQLLAGGGFDDWYYGNNTTDGDMTTLTFEHLTVFKGGDVFFFADLTHGEFAAATGAATGQERHVYSELALRVSPLQLAGVTPQGFVRDVLAAASIERGGDGFSTYLVGAGVDLRVPGFTAASLNVFYRDDVFNEGTYQVTAVWNVPIPLGRVRATFEGFVDVHGTDADGTDVHTQPQLHVGLGALPLSVGAELYVHRNDALSVVVPQLLAKWYF